MSITTTEPPSSRRNRRWLITGFGPTLAMAIAVGGGAVLGGCEDETAVEEAAEETGDAMEEGMEEAGDAMEEAGDEMGG